MVSHDTLCADLKEIQLVQNELLCLLNGSKIKDKISTESMLVKFNVLSVNQMNAQIKLQQMWKALNMEDYPLTINQQSVPESGVTTRASLWGKPVEIGTSNLTQSTCTSDAIRVWNKAPKSVTECLTLYQVKKAIKEFVKSLPI